MRVCHGHDGRWSFPHSSLPVYLFTFHIDGPCHHAPFLTLVYLFTFHIDGSLVSKLLISTKRKIEIQKKYIKQKRADSGSFVSYVDMGGIKPLSMPSMSHFFTHRTRSCHVLQKLCQNTRLGVSDATYERKIGKPKLGFSPLATNMKDVTTLKYSNSPLTFLVIVIIK